MNSEILLNALMVSDTNSLGLIDLALALILPFLLSFPATWVYQKVQASHSYSTAFVQSFFLFASLSSVMTLIIGNNIARAFGLIGALSIIRFRNALKSPLDAVYIFWALAIGMACGTGYYLAAIVLTFVVGCFSLLLQRLGYGEIHSFESIMRIGVSPDDEENTVEHIESQFREAGLDFARMNVIFDSAGNDKIYVYSLSSDKEPAFTRLRDELGRIQGTNGIQHLNSTPSLFAA